MPPSNEPGSYGSLEAAIGTVAAGSAAVAGASPTDAAGFSPSAERPASVKRTFPRVGYSISPSR